MKYRVKRIITKEECDWLDNEIKENTIVYKFYGATYGCIGPNGTAVSFHPPDDSVKNPFFELPRDALELVDGE